MPARGQAGSNTRHVNSAALPLSDMRSRAHDYSLLCASLQPDAANRARTFPDPTPRDALGLHATLTRMAHPLGALHMAAVATPRIVTQDQIEHSPARPARGQTRTRSWTSWTYSGSVLCVASFSRKFIAKRRAPLPPPRLRCWAPQPSHSSPRYA